MKQNDFEISIRFQGEAVFLLLMVPRLIFSIQGSSMAFLRDTAQTNSCNIRISSIAAI